MNASKAETAIYQGQFGEFTITATDRRGVVVYRAGLTIAAASFAIATSAVLYLGATPSVLAWLTVLYALFSLGLGVSLLTIHIYLVPLHRLLQVFWAIGTIAAIAVSWRSDLPLLQAAYERPIALIGLGFAFAALTGIFFKEAFCFDRFETKFLTPLVPLLLLGHVSGLLPLAAERGLLVAWSVLFLIFALRKCVQPIPSDIGDKSVFAYLKQRAGKAA
ncbi:uncharacterized integral membrane protein [Rubidibacter lacunae KORDI 51-2]|uniref:Uncharacterized integral membrane protein n=1 Tax=Rubidibacter lacunae KORDI 51-2 TaxID=582515 RepID=U5DKL2_9CHRO|nr:DUF2301 domain-containing membrane protein [Rubidibacter lacunae]ERN41452.1 uncharacterized integral membrane protein [Rubidibacter lacunae KORDI 51-2]